MLFNLFSLPYFVTQLVPECSSIQYAYMSVLLASVKNLAWLNFRFLFCFALIVYNISSSLPSVTTKLCPFYFLIVLLVKSVVVLLAPFVYSCYHHFVSVGVVSIFKMYINMTFSSIAILNEVFLVFVCLLQSTNIRSMLLLSEASYSNKNIY